MRFYYCGGGIAVIESHISESLQFLESPGIPWNLDIVLLAIVYLAIGFYFQDKIRDFMCDKERKYDIVALCIAAILICFCIFNYWHGRRHYYFDMKPLYYKELISAVLIPCAFGVVLLRAVYWIDKANFLWRIEEGLCYIGQMSLPIMFLHVPLNTYKQAVGYGRITYILIGVGLPIVFSLIFGRFEFMRILFGLPKVCKYEE